MTMVHRFSGQKLIFDELLQANLVQSNFLKGGYLKKNVCTFFLKVYWSTFSFCYKPVTKAFYIQVNRYGQDEVIDVFALYVVGVISGVLGFA